MEKGLAGSANCSSHVSDSTSCPQRTSLTTTTPPAGTVLTFAGRFQFSRGMPLRAGRARAPRTEAAPARRHHQGNLDLVPERLRLTCSTRRGPGLLVAGLLGAGSAPFGKPLGPAPAGAGGTGPGRSGSWAF